MATDPRQSIAELEALRFGFDNLPLEQFRGLSATEIEAHAGIGPKYRTRIQEALAELDRLRAQDGPLPTAAAPAGPAPLTAPDQLAEENAAAGPATEPLEAAPEPGETPPKPIEVAEASADELAAGQPDPYLEPAAPGTSGPTVFLMAALLLAIIITVVVFASGRDRTRAMQLRLNQAEALVTASQQALAGLDVGLARDAQGQVARVYQKVRSRNLGDALEDLLDVESSLRSIAGAGAAVASPERTAAVQKALQQLQATRAALLLAEPRSQEQLEAATASLQLAIEALQPQEVKE